MQYQRYIAPKLPSASPLQMHEALGMDTTIKTTGNNLVCVLSSYLLIWLASYTSDAFISEEQDIP